MQRNLAFCVGQWSADSTLFSWTYAKQYFLRKVRDDQGSEVLSDLDKLYVVHVNNGKSARDGWDAGGPILPRLSTALANYPHTIVELEGRDTATAILDFAAREEIDVLILGSREHKGAMTKMVPGVSALGSTSDSVKARCRCPCLIIRPSSARKEKMRIKSLVNLGQLVEGQGLAPGNSLPQPVKATVLTATAGPEPRKVALAFEHPESGNNMTAWAAKHCFFPDDDIHLVHMTNRSPLEKMQKSASFQKAMLKPRAAEPATHSEMDIADVGKEELQAYEEPRRARLKGDAKSELCEYLDDHHIDLMIVGFSATNRIKQAFAGGSLSSHMLHHAPCPIVVLPLKSMAWEEQDTLGHLPELRPSISGGFDAQLSPTVDGASPPPIASLGPRVSLSRSLSNQFSQGKDQFRKSIEKGASPSSKSMPDAFQSTVDVADRSAARPSLEDASATARIASSRRRSHDKFVALPSPSADPSMPAPTSPFEGVAHEPHRSEAGLETRAAASDNEAGPHRSPSSADVIALLRLQLADRDAQVAALQENVRQLKFQVAALQGSSNASSRVMLPAS